MWVSNLICRFYFYLKMLALLYLPSSIFFLGGGMCKNFNFDENNGGILL